jgi:monooxygenase
LVAEHFDVVIIGAGLSGIGTAHHLQTKCPGKGYAILEARGSIGGTWDLFRYPGVRSDSDMYTLGYRLRPWAGEKSIADGPSILDYVRQTAREQGIDRHIRFHSRVVRASWNSAAAQWTLEVETSRATEVITCHFLVGCTGYYNYESGFAPTWPGMDEFGGRIIHPQQWPEDLDYAGKRVVVIGSGATAVTLVPAMAGAAGHVTMLQRSPTYILSIPNSDPIGKVLRLILPARAAFQAVRWKNVLISFAIYQISRRRPGMLAKFIRRGVVRAMPKGFDVDTHFAPRYNPWDQRLCLVPDGDLFRVLRGGRASVVTDEIETFTPNGIRLRSGEHLDADIVVSATGLRLLVLGGVQLVVDGKEVRLSETIAYRSMMLAGVPNFAFAVGYTNASWTLKIDLVSEYVCRLLNYLDRKGYRSCVPALDSDMESRPLLDFQAGYVLRSLDQIPRQGTKDPWRVSMNYLRDRREMRRGSLTESMEFQPGGRR